ncbi:hypothetical protein I308_102725 [Cryptococcus tetragattii IND107]|uniref:Uncharacterized protein n=1 Tax=Cryptococcus tetragattii IND107 TaxID=1296105 RepID=A0ABR3BUC3_9TREE|nr:hypothetical protein I308_01764 [Cryptococcus tetragattii IND107]
MPDPSATSLVQIPSTGVEFFEYRRRLFMAGLPCPETPTTQPLPATYLVPAQPPPPLPRPSRPPKHPSVAKIEEALSTEGAEASRDLWEGGMKELARNLHDGRKFTKGMRLGLVIKILIASWINDGLWPIDPLTGLPEKPPASPLIEGVDLFPEDTLESTQQSEKN